jgi:DNA-binding NarL/FixJ family response regulator
MTGHIRVLVADDHPIVREGLATVLDQEEDLEVVGEAANGVEAVNLAREWRPDIVLMDLQMPEMNGVEAITKINEELPSIEVIILTTYDTDEYIFSGIEAGAQAYLLKDSPPDEVLRAIRAVHRGESLVQPRVTRKLLERFTELSHASLSPEQVPETPISPRELEVLELIARGRSNKSIAGDLVIGESTVKTHIIHIFNKLSVKDRTEAVTEAIRRGIIQL